jgi:uracil-DNA glycosylase
MAKASADRALQSLLDFYVESGIDCALDEAPRDRFAEARQQPSRPVRSNAEAPQSIPAAELPRRTLPKAAAPAEEVATDARAKARDAQSLEELEALLASFDGCALKFSAKNLAFADGNPQGRVMFVGEAPGADEDRIGKPFMGRAGQLLDRMLTAIGLDRGQVYIANIVPWRPPGNRMPTPQEVAVCRPFIERQIELAAPEFLVCLGGAATQALLGTKDGILKSRGRWFPYHAGERGLRALATLHPAYLLRQPVQKRLAWRDFLALRRALDGRS